MTKLKKLAKPNQLIAVIPEEDITLVERKAYNTLLKYAQIKLNNGYENNVFLIPRYELKKIAGIKEKDYSKIHKRLERLMKTVVRIFREKDNKKEWEESFTLLSYFGKDGENFKFELNHFIINALKEYSFYTTLDLAMINGLTCKYAIILYELAIRYKDYKIPKMTIGEFREITNTTDQYKQFYNFRLRVLDPACEEITEKTNINISYETEKRGRRIGYINFKTEVKEELSLNINKAEDSCYDAKELDGIFKQIVK